MCFLARCLFRRLLALSCALRSRSLALIGECERHLPQHRRRAHPKREKGPFLHPLSLDDCFGWRAVLAAYPLLPLRTAPKKGKGEA